MAEKFSSEDKTRLIKTIQDLFGESGAFDGFLADKLGKVVPSETGLREIRSRAHSVIDVAEREQWLPGLLNALRDQFPEDESILLVYGRFFSVGRVASGAERLVTDFSFDYPAVVRRKSWELENRICRIEIDFGKGIEPFGTGFLVGPDLVLTNYHVMKPVFSNQVAIGNVYFSFDRKMAEDGHTAVPAVTVKAAGGNPVLSWSPDTPADDQGHDLQYAWGDTQLDFALVKLELQMGKTRPGTKAISAAGEISRGWVSIPEADIKIEAGKKLIIYQHPRGDLLREAIGFFLSPATLNASRTRFRYTTNTEGGSSGSPCINHLWQLVGIHHYGDPVNAVAQYNQGIPIDKIRDKIVADGVVLEPFRGETAGGSESGREMIVPDIAAVASGPLDVDRFVEIARVAVGTKPKADGQSDPERIEAILIQALRRGKLKRLLDSARFEMPADLALHQLIEKFTQLHEDPCDTVLLKGYRLFFNRRFLRDAVRRIDESTEPQTYFVQGKPMSGHSQTFWYLQHLKENSDLIDQLVLLDLREISMEEEISQGKVFFTRPVVANLIFKSLGLKPPEWDDEYKSRDFCNALVNALKDDERRVALVLDGFRHARSMTEDIVFDMIQMMVKRVDRDLSHFHIFLLDFHEALAPEVLNSVTTDELGAISRDELLGGIQELYELRRKKYPDRTFTEEDIARTYLEMTKGKDQDSFLAGELAPQDVRIARALLN